MCRRDLEKLIINAKHDYVRFAGLRKMMRDFRKVSPMKKESWSKLLDGFELTDDTERQKMYAFSITWHVWELMNVSPLAAILCNIAHQSVALFILDLGGAWDYAGECALWQCCFPSFHEHAFVYVYMNTYMFVNVYIKPCKYMQACKYM